MSISITSTSVAPQANAQIISGTIGAGTTVLAGMLMYYDTVTGTYLLAQSTTAAALSVVAGMAISSGSPGQSVFIQVAGDVAIGAVILTGTPYMLSATAQTTNGLLETTPPAANKYPCLIGMGISTSILRLSIAAHNNVAVA